jgi:NADP-dependent aldehyde dehydrogenase
MVHPSIKKGYDAALEDKRKMPFVESVFLNPGKGTCAVTEAPSAVFRVSAREFLAHPEAAEEMFGPACLAVLCDGAEELRRVAESLAGQLTACVHGTEAELAAEKGLFAALERKAGRLIVNGFPTGVEVCPSMNHGGPFPATSFPHFTSVGTAAIYRFTRPVCYQNFPQALLPAELRDGNPLGIWRLADGRFGK